MFDTDPFDQMAQHHHDSSEFTTPFIAAIVGAYIGHKLDQTRFGIWFNNSPTITGILGLLKVAAILFAIYCCCLFFYFVIRGY